MSLREQLFEGDERILQDPDEVGETAYRAVYEAVDDASADGDIGTVIGTLDNLIDWATSIRDKLRAMS